MNNDIPAKSRGVVSYPCTNIIKLLLLEQAMVCISIRLPRFSRYHTDRANSDKSSWYCTDPQNGNDNTNQYWSFVRGLSEFPGGRWIPPEGGSNQESVSTLWRYNVTKFCKWLTSCQCQQKQKTLKSETIIILMIIVQTVYNNHIYLYFIFNIYSSSVSSGVHHLHSWQ